MRSRYLFFFLFITSLLTLNDAFFEQLSMTALIRFFCLADEKQAHRQKSIASIFNHGPF